MAPIRTSDLSHLEVTVSNNGLNMGDTSSSEGNESSFVYTPAPTPSDAASTDFTQTGDIESSLLSRNEAKALRRLLESWMERLQLISVLSIFFASTEATLLSITTPAQGQERDMSMLASAANAGLTGGLVLHILAAFISFLGGFFLVRHKIKWALTERQSMAKKRERNIIDLSPGDTFVVSPVDVDSVAAGKSEAFPASLQRKPKRSMRAFAAYPSTLIAAYLSAWNEESPQQPSQIHRIPTRLLTRFHFMCVVLTLLGFFFSVIGLVCDAYDRLPPIIGTVALVVISLSLLIVIAIFLIPEESGHIPEEGKGEV